MKVFSIEVRQTKPFADVLDPKTTRTALILSCVVGDDTFGYIRTNWTASDLGKETKGIYQFLLEQSGIELKAGATHKFAEPLTIPGRLFTYAFPADEVWKDSAGKQVTKITSAYFGYKDGDAWLGQSLNSVVASIKASYGYHKESEAANTEAAED